ncbi:MAG: hypothetical protein B7Z37_22180 [Verrucomicrobia bacterium 12-59-8]|nr:MAG: hypothetical protein B7Z37_22180 [Verrucomicrobia bacterium 12-59-8]
MKDFVEAGLASVRRCPLCQGPLLTHAQLHEHERTAKEALDRLRRQSAVTMEGTALLMLVAQAVFSFLQSAEVAGFFNWLTLGVAVSSMVAAALWQITAQRIWMLTGAVLLQTAAALFFFLVLGMEHHLIGGLSFIPARWSLGVAALPMAGAMLAWHQYRSYAQLLRLERSKGKGCQVPA